MAATAASSVVSSKPRVTHPDLDEEDEEEVVLVWKLAAAKDIVIADDSTAHALFATLSAPQEDLVEALYEDMGSPRLSSLCKERYESKGSPSSSSTVAHDVRKLVLERTALFLYERQTYGKDSVRRDAEWMRLGDNFKVVEVET